VHPELRREIREGLVRRVLPAFAIMGLLVWWRRRRPTLDWETLSADLAIGLLVGIAIVIVLQRRRIRAAGWAPVEPGSRVEIVLQVRPAVLLLALAASVVIGFVTGRLGIGRRYALSIAISLLMLGVGLSLRPTRRPESQGAFGP
jgi:hypothetical protein